MEEHQPREWEELRKKAEERLEQAKRPASELSSDLDVRALLHELQVHQVELEAQNDELVAAAEQTEKALRKYSDLYDFAPVGYATIDREGRIVETNLTLSTMLGVPRSLLMNALLRHFISVDNRSTFDELHRSLQVGGEPVSAEVVMLKDGGERFHALLKASASPERSEKGLWRVAVADITKLKVAEEELQRANEELEDRVFQRTVELTLARAEAERRAAELDVLMESVPAAVLVAEDAECRKIRGNWAARELLKIGAEENMSRSAPEGERPTHWQEMRDGVPIPPDELPAQRACRGNYIRNYEMDIVFDDGQTTNVLGHASPLFNDQGEPRGSITVLVDITARKAAELEAARARAEAQQRAGELESFIASMADGVIIFDGNGNVTFINDVGMDLLGVPLGQNLDDWLGRVRMYDLEGEIIPLNERPLYRALKEDGVSDMRVQIEMPWGKRVIVSVSSCPVRGGEGEVLGATFVFRDQSERVRIEKDKQALLERERHIAEVLEHTVIPSSTKKVKGLDLAVRYEPSSAEAGIGGDFYDIFELGDGKVGVLIGDVTGKGLAAAVGITAVRHSIRSYAYLDPRPSRVLTLANEALWRSLVGSDDLGMLTTFFAVVDTRFGEVSYASGGHEPAVLKTTDGRVERLDVRGPLLGVIKDVEYDERSRKLQPGDRVVMVTDGITEARPCPEELLGVEGVEHFLSTFSAQDNDSIADGIVQIARDHAGGQLLDDAAVVVVSLENRQPKSG